MTVTIRKVFLYIALALILAIPLAPVLLWTGCLIVADYDLALCHHPQRYYIAIGVGFVITVGGSYLDLVRRARRAARGRVRLRPVMVAQQWDFLSSMPSIFGSSSSQVLDMRDSETLGWVVPFEDDNGRRVEIRVFKMDMYRWLVDCYIKQSHYKQPRKSALSWNENAGRITGDRPQWQARMVLLEGAGGIRRYSDATNATRHLLDVPDQTPIGAAWHIVDQLIEAKNPAEPLM
ncbi:MAG: hypothetical protein AAF485_05730 [Chloroflexota bacterium]